jgi:hypothetical protein
MPQEPPHFHGAELRKIADERRWERNKVFLTFAGQLAIALAGLWIGISLEQLRGSQQAEAKRIEYRTQFYKDVSDKLNTLYIFACSVGDYSLIAPSRAGQYKRQLEAAFTQNLPHMSSDTYEAFRNFTDGITKQFRRPGQHFQFVGLIDERRKAYNQRKVEFEAKQKKEESEAHKRPEEPAPPGVTEPELEEWFTNTAINATHARKSFARLLASVARDSGFGSFDEERAKESLRCVTK